MGLLMEDHPEMEENKKRRAEEQDLARTVVEPFAGQDRENAHIHGVSDKREGTADHQGLGGIEGRGRSLAKPREIPSGPKQCRRTQDHQWNAKERGKPRLEGHGAGSHEHQPGNEDGERPGNKGHEKGRLEMVLQGEDALPGTRLPSW